MRRVTAVAFVVCVAAAACTGDESPSAVVPLSGEPVDVGGSGEPGGSEADTGLSADDVPAASGSSPSSDGTVLPAGGTAGSTSTLAAGSPPISAESATSTPSVEDTGPLTFTRIADPLLEPERRGGAFATLDVLDGQGFVIGGHDAGDDGTPRPVVWRSTNAGDWARDELPAPATGATIEASVVVDDRLLLFGADPVAGRPVAWSISSSGAVEEIAVPTADRRWSVAAAQRWGDSVLLWGRREPAPGAPPVLASVSDDAVATLRPARAINRLLAGHGARSVIDVDTGAAGAAALLSTGDGDVLVLVDDGRGWLAWSLDSSRYIIAGVEVTSDVRLSGAVVGPRGARPAVFEQAPSGGWRPVSVDVLSDDRNAGFQSSTGDQLHDSFLDGRVLTGNVSAAEILAVPAGRGTWQEASYPDAVEGQGQPPIADVGRSDGVTLAIAAGRPTVVRLDRFAVTPVTDDSFPGGSSLPTAAGVVAAGELIALRGAYTTVPAGTGPVRRSWARWNVGNDDSISIDGAAGGEQLELADLEATRDGTLLGVGYEGFVPANFEDFIQPYEFVDLGGDFRARVVRGGERTVRFHEVADAGPAMVAAGTVFGTDGRLEPVLYRRRAGGRWRPAPLPVGEDGRATTGVDLVDMCPLPTAGAVLFTTGDSGEHPTFVTGDGISWERFVPAELAVEGLSLLGCAPAGDHVLVFGELDGRAQLWRTADGQRYDVVPTPDDVGLVDAAVDEGGGVWLLAPGNRVVHLDRDGRRLSTSTLGDDQLASPAGAGTLSGIAVTPARVVVLGTWNDGIGLWSAPRR